MARAVADLSVDELKALIGDLLEEKLRALLADPDHGLTLAPELEVRLESQLRETAAGERGLDFEALHHSLGLPEA